MVASVLVFKSSNGAHTDVGDRANDVLRIDGRDRKAKVVGEGGNLGMTQLGVSNTLLTGGRVNTDFVDNVEVRCWLFG